jgi:hypothetical protein
LLHPGSRIRIPDPGGKKAPDPGSGSETLVQGKESLGNAILHEFPFLSDHKNFANIEAQMKH